MTLPSESKKLTKSEVDSIEIAVNDTDIRSIHPEKLEAYADILVEKLKDKEKNDCIEWQILSLSAF